MDIREIYTDRGCAEKPAARIESVNVCKCAFQGSL